MNGQTMDSQSLSLSLSSFITGMGLLTRALLDLPPSQVAHVTAVEPSLDFLTNGLCEQVEELLPTERRAKRHAENTKKLKELAAKANIVVDPQPDASIGLEEETESLTESLPGEDQDQDQDQDQDHDHDTVSDTLEQPSANGLTFLPPPKRQFERRIQGSTQRKRLAPFGQFYEYTVLTRLLRFGVSFRRRQSKEEVTIAFQAMTIV